jgi:predicted SAM-dependent methyltransferase
MPSVATRLRKGVRRRIGRVLRPPPYGAAKSRAPQPPAGDQPSRLEVRRDFVFRTAPRDGTVLEIGPAHNAILPKRDGFRTRTVDYLDRDGLVEKYRSFKQYDPNDIEAVDYVIAVGEPMANVIDERFDVVLASHVLEHSLSVIDFINDCTTLLAPGGVVSLIVPDHRYCFDRFRERSSIGRVIDAADGRRRTHSVGTLAEFSLNAVKHRGTTSWAAGHRGEYRFVHSPDEVRKNVELARGTEYIDVHNWVFSPNHLRLLLEDLHALGLISVREAAFQDTIGHEFFLNLAVDAPGPGLSREALLVLADAERTGMDHPVFEGSKAAPTAPVAAGGFTAEAGR